MITTNQDVYLKNFNKVTFDRPYCELPPGELWRILLVDEILEAKHGELKVENFEVKELDEIIRCAFAPNFLLFVNHFHVFEIYQIIIIT